jgi:hypothetical protein
LVEIVYQSTAETSGSKKSAIEDFMTATYCSDCSDCEKERDRGKGKLEAECPNDRMARLYTWEKPLDLE